MDLSIIIPVHNLEHFIQPLLSSLYNQAIQNIDVEYIFVLDGCTDNTQQIIESWIPIIKNGTIKIYHTNYHCCGSARNYGIEHSTGTYIWFVDGDDMLLGQQAIQIAYNTAVQNNVSILRFDFLSIWKVLIPNYQQFEWMMVWQYLFKRDLIKDLRFPHIQPSEDTVFMQQVYEIVGTTIPTLSIPLYLYNYDRKGSNMVLYHEGTNINPEKGN